MSQVVWSKRLHKQLVQLPHFIVDRFRGWVMAVETDGIWQVRRLPGFHDEPLLGQRKGQRSVRLNRAYRVIYREIGEILEVIEVSKHEY